MQTIERVSVDRVPIANGDSGYLLVRPAHPDGRSALLGHGYMSNPYHLQGLAEELALEGFTVGVVEYGEPLQDEHYALPSDYKLRRAHMVIEDMERHGTADEWLIAAHSYGGVVLKKLLEDCPVLVDEAHFISALGFGEPVKVLHPDRLWDVARMYGSELFSAFTRGRNVFNVHALSAQTSTLLHRSHRTAELDEITHLGHNCALQAIQHAEQMGVRVSVHIAPRDHVVNPGNTAIAMHGNVNIIHAKANHFAPITHPRRVAHAVLDLINT